MAMICFKTSMVPLCQAVEEKKVWTRDFVLFHTTALHSQQASHGSPQHCTQTAQSWSGMKGTLCTRQIHSLVLETLEEVLNFHALYGSEIPYNSCLTQVQALFEKALYAVTAGCKTEQERMSTSEQGFHSLPLEWQWIKTATIAACEYWCNYRMVPHIIMQNKSNHKLM